MAHKAIAFVRQGKLHIDRLIGDDSKAVLAFWRSIGYRDATIVTVDTTGRIVPETTIAPNSTAEWRKRRGLTPPANPA